MVSVGAGLRTEEGSSRYSSMALGSVFEPGQTVIAHGPDRDLTVVEALPAGKAARSEHAAANPRDCGGTCLDCYR